MTVKELRKLLKNYDADTLVLMDASMRGFDVAEGVITFDVIINKRADDNGEGAYLSADGNFAEKHKRRHERGLMLHTAAKEQ